MSRKLFEYTPEDLDNFQHEPQTEDTVSVSYKELNDTILSKNKKHDQFYEHLDAAIADGKKAFPGDFFITLIADMEKIGRMIGYYPMRFRWFIGKTCPYPRYNMHVYWYKKEDNDVSLLWVIPKRNVFAKYKNDPLGYRINEPEYAKMMEKFINGEMDTECDQINNLIFNKMKKDA